MLPTSVPPSGWAGEFSHPFRGQASYTNYCFSWVQRVCPNLTELTGHGVGLMLVIQLLSVRLFATVVIVLLF